MSIRDDSGIPIDAVAWRALIRRWVTTTPEGHRQTSDCFDSELHRRETSCFLVTDDMLGGVSELIPDAYAFAGFPVQVLRSNGFGVERRPEECPSNYAGNRADHVVVGPIEDISKKEYVRRTKSIVRNPQVRLRRIISEAAEDTTEGRSSL